jgi:hypothetical protein
MTQGKLIQTNWRLKIADWIEKLLRGGAKLLREYCLCHLGRIGLFVSFDYLGTGPG